MQAETEFAAVDSHATSQLNFPMIKRVLFGSLTTISLAIFMNSVSARVSPEAVEFTVGNIEFVLLHELAHVLISDLKVPVLGPEESAADYFAAVILASDQQSGSERAGRARQALLATADGLATSWEKQIELGLAKPYWATHDLTIQRFYNIVCLMYGSNPEAFPQLPLRVVLPKARADGCSSEYARAAKAVDWLSAMATGTQDNMQQVGRIEVVYEMVRTTTSRDIVKALQSSHSLDGVLGHLQVKFPITNPIRIVFKTCRVPESKWVSDLREIVFCYELVDVYTRLARSRSTTERFKQ